MIKWKMIRNICIGVVSMVTCCCILAGCSLFENSDNENDNDIDAEQIQTIGLTQASGLVIWNSVETATKYVIYDGVSVVGTTTDGYFDASDYVGRTLKVDALNGNDKMIGTNSIKIDIRLATDKQLIVDSNAVWDEAQDNIHDYNSIKFDLVKAGANELSLDVEIAKSINKVEFIGDANVSYRNVKIVISQRNTDIELVFSMCNFVADYNSNAVIYKEPNNKKSGYVIVKTDDFCMFSGSSGQIGADGEDGKSFVHGTNGKTGGEGGNAINVDNLIVRGSGSCSMVGGTGGAGGTGGSAGESFPPNKGGNGGNGGAGGTGVSCDNIIQFKADGGKIKIVGGAGGSGGPHGPIDIFGSNDSDGENGSKGKDTSTDIRII